MIENISTPDNQDSNLVPPPSSSPQTLDDDIELMDEFVYKPMRSLSDFPLIFKYHVMFAIFASILCFFLWRSTAQDINKPTGTIWWWIFPLFFFFLSVTVHKMIFIEKAYFKSVYVLSGILNVLLFLINYISPDPDEKTFPWFFFPLCVFFMGCLVVRHFEVDSYSILSLLVHEFLILNLMLFITWLITKGFPWFFYPLLGLGLPLLCFYIKKTYNHNGYFVYIVFASIDICLICFITWAFTEVAFPWFLFIWIFFILVIFFLASRNKNAKNHMENLSSNVKFLFIDNAQQVETQDPENNSESKSEVVSSDLEGEDVLEQPKTIYPKID